MERLRTRKIAFVGGGTMAEAMIVGLIQRAGVPPKQILATGPRRTRLWELEERYGIHTSQENREASRWGEIVVLSVKPQVAGRVLEELKGTLSEPQLLLSIVAGLSVARIQEEVGHRTVIRAMPNTPARIGQGMTVWVAAEEVDPPQRELARAVLQALGEEVEVKDERQVDMATAVSGTGPAYVFLWMEAMIDAAVHLGFSRHVAEKLVLQTMLGSVLYAREVGLHPAILRNQVTSPGGTSAAALYELEKAGVRTALAKAIWAAYRRARELGEG